MLHVALGLGGAVSGYSTATGGSAELRLVLKNFVWRLEALTPSRTEHEQKALFRHIDPKRKDPETQGNRRFTVSWLGSEEDHQVGDEWIGDSESERPAKHAIELEVFYQAKQGWEDLHDLIASDRHDITKNLRSDANLIGYSDEFPSTQIGLWERTRETDELDRGDDIIWTLRQQWRCIINETEV